MYVKAMFQEKVSGSWVNVESWEDSSNTITASGLEIYLVSRGTYRVTMTCSVNGEIKTATSAEKNYQFVEKCFATMDGSGAHEESIMARNLRSETEEILNENIDKSYGFTCIIGYLVFYDFDVFRMPDGFRYSFRKGNYCV